jgi:dTDP-4-amino-4,6-dideoxygalactose transaminase
VFIDSDFKTWNMDPLILSKALDEAAAQGRLPKVVIVVHLYGQSADMDPILAACDRHGVPVIEDAAEALGASYKERAPGTMGRLGIYSFNGNKIITTSSGGMLVSADKALVERARFLATQARDPAPHYQHSVAGYNYRLSNILAGIGRGQLRVLDERVAARRRNFEFYQKELGDLPGLKFMPEAGFGRSNRWLTCLLIDPVLSGGVDREQVRLAMEAVNIEARPVWKPLHLQPLFTGARVIGGAVAEKLFADGLCLPSGSNLEAAELERVVSTLRRCFEKTPAIT